MKKDKKLSDSYIRKQGWIDGYYGLENNWEYYIRFFLYKKLNTEDIIHKILMYCRGYNIGNITSKDLKNLHIKHNKYYYKGYFIEDKVEINEFLIKNKIKELTLGKEVT